MTDDVDLAFLRMMDIRPVRLDELAAEANVDEVTEWALRMESTELALRARRMMENAEPPVIFYDPDDFAEDEPTRPYRRKR